MALFFWTLEDVTSAALVWLYEYLPVLTCSVLPFADSDATLGTLLPETIGLTPLVIAFCLNARSMFDD